MSFKDFIGTLAKELGAEIEIENDLCAISLGAAEGDRIDILLQGFDRRGVLLATADLGEAPPEGREALYQTLLEANDLFAGTLGATLSLNPANGRVRLQRFDDGTVFGDIKDNGKRLEHVRTHGRFVFNPEYKAVE